MSDWTSVLKANPSSSLLESASIGLKNRMLRDVICSGDGYPEEPVVEDSVYKSISRRQKPDGSWREAGSKKNDEMWTFIATLKSLYLLLDLGSNMDDEIFELGVKYLLAFQSKDGDFRGVYGHDIPAPDYTGMALDILFRGNFDNDSVVEKSFDWLISVRRKGEGWAIPALRSKSKNDPSSHNVTGMVLRGFASDPKKRYKEEAEKAGRLLANCIFKPDKYPDRRGVEYWGKLAYPFWFTDALSTLDVLSRLGFDLSVDEMKRAYNWILKQQSESGYWKSGPTRREEKPDPWLTYAALRTIKSLTD